MFRQCIIYALVFVISIIIATSQNDKLQGEFNLVVKNIKRCKGPKRKDCCTITTRIHDSRLLYNIQAQENVPIDTGKITMDSDGRQVAKLQMKKTCNHIFVGPAIRELLNLSKDCIFKKGNHTINVNLENIIRTLNGGIFLYGNITFKYIFHNDICNFMCEIMDVESVPKHKSA